MSIIQRLVKGTPLTHSELDANFTYLEGNINSLSSTVAARSANVSVQTPTEVTGYSTLDAALAQTSTPGVTARINAGSVGITVSNYVRGLSKWPAYIDAGGATVTVADATVLSLAQSIIASLTIENAYFYNTGIARTAIITTIAGAGVLASGACGQLINCYSEVAIQLNSDSLAIINGTFSSIIGTGTLYLFGNAKVTSVAAGITVYDYTGKTLDDKIAVRDYYLGNWNPTTNVPTLTAGVGIKGNYYNITNTSIQVTKSVIVDLAAGSPANSFTVGSVTGLVVGMTVFVYGAAMGKIISINTATLTITLDKAPTDGGYGDKLICSFPFDGNTSYVNGGVLQFNGTKWVSGPGSHASTLSIIQDYTTNIIFPRTRIDYSNAQMVNSGGTTAAFSGQVYLVGDGSPGNYNITLPSAATADGQSISFVCRLGPITLVFSGGVVDGRTSYAMKTGDSLIIQRSSTVQESTRTSWSIIKPGLGYTANYKGLWNPATNTPNLSSSLGYPGDYYRMSSSGLIVLHVTPTSASNTNNFLLDNVSSLTVGMMLEAGSGIYAGIIITAINGLGITTNGVMNLTAGQTIVFKSAIGYATDFVKGQELYWTGASPTYMQSPSTVLNSWATRASTIPEYIAAPSTGGLTLDTNTGFSIVAGGTTGYALSRASNGSITWASVSDGLLDGYNYGSSTTAGTITSGANIKSGILSLDQRSQMGFIRNINGVLQYKNTFADAISDFGGANYGTTIPILMKVPIADAPYNATIDGCYVSIGGNTLSVFGNMTCNAGTRLQNGYLFSNTGSNIIFNANYSSEESYLSNVRIGGITVLAVTGSTAILVMERVTSTSNFEITVASGSTLIIRANCDIDGVTLTNNGGTIKDYRNTVKSPNGTRYKITVADGGAISAVAAGF